VPVVTGPPDPGSTAALRAVCAAIPRGRWATYGDVAEAAGRPGGARWAARALAAGGVPHAHRVLRAGGVVAAGYREGDGRGPEAARERLAAEGLAFDARGAADPGRRWVPQSPGPTTR
jgi:alkylated DNA nucleotide flippase Atl1